MSNVYYEISIRPRDDYLIHHPNAFCLKPKEDMSWEKTCHYIDVMLEQGGGIVFYIDAQRNDDNSPDKSFVEYNQWLFIHVDPRHGFKIQWRIKNGVTDLSEDELGMTHEVPDGEEEVQFGNHGDFFKKKHIFTDYEKMKQIVKYIFDHGQVPEEIKPYFKGYY